MSVIVRDVVDFADLFVDSTLVSFAEISRAE